jgi:hypothetical protein
MPDTPKNLEDLVRLFGRDNMEMFHEMVRPDQHVEHDEEGIPAQSDRAPEVVLDPERERAIIEHMEARLGRKATPEERWLALEQAKLL